MSETPTRAPEGEGQESVWALLKRLGATVWAAVFTVTVPAAGGLLLYKFGGPIAECWRGLGAWGVVAYAAAFSVPLGAALLPTWVQALLAGFVFAGVGEGAFEISDWGVVRKRGRDCRRVRVAAGSAGDSLSSIHDFAACVGENGLQTLKRSWVRAESVYAEAASKLRADIAADGAGADDRDPHETFRE